MKETSIDGFVFVRIEGATDSDRVLNRDRWSALAAVRMLLGLLVAAFASSGVLVFGTDDTIERRRGANIRAKGIYRDPVRSSHSHFVQVQAQVRDREEVAKARRDDQPSRRVQIGILALMIAGCVLLALVLFARALGARQSPPLMLTERTH